MCSVLCDVFYFSRDKFNVQTNYQDFFVKCIDFNFIFRASKLNYTFRLDLDFN